MKLFFFQGAGEGGQDKRELEHGLTFSMLGVRVAEMKGAWLENQQELVAGLVQVEDRLGVWLDGVTGLGRRGEEVTAMHRAMSMLKEAEVNPGHRLHTLLDIYQREKTLAAAVSAARQQVVAFTGECDKMIVLHQRARASISGPQLAKWGGETRVLVEQVSSAATVQTFLENAGQRDLLGQYSQTEQEVLGGLARLGEEVGRTLDKLNMYHAITNLYPATATSQHRVNMYSIWGSRILENFNIETCDQIAAEFASLFSVQPTRVRELKTQHVLKMNLQLEKWNKEIVSTMQKSYQRMMSENIMKPGKSGVQDEMNKMQEMILNQLNHPDSGVRAETLICFLLKSLLDSAKKWSDIEKNMAEECDESLMDQMLLESGCSKTLLTTGEMLNIIKSSPHLAVLESLSTVLSSLDTLRTSFCTIIMPEGIKNFLQGGGDQSVVEICEQIEEIITSGGLSMEEIKHETRLHTRCCMLAMESSHLATMELVMSMRERFQELVTAAGSSDNMNTGQMLVCAANSLFDKVDTDMAALREQVLAVTVPAECSKFGLVRSAADVSTAAFNTSPGVWESLMSTVFLSKLELLRTFLSLCRGVSLAFRCEDMSLGMPTGDLVVSPVRRFIAEYCQLMLLGTGPRHLAATITQFARDTAELPVNRFFEVNQSREKLDMEELWKAVFDDKMSTGALNQARIAKSGVLVTNLTSVVHKWVLAKQLDTAVEVLSSAQQINALQHAGVQWYHEENIPREANVKLAEPVRLDYFELF